MGERTGRERPDADWLMSISDIRMLFKLGRTAAYQLTRRPGFPAPVQLSRRCLRWWASEIDAYAETPRRNTASPRIRAVPERRPRPGARSRYWSNWR